MTSDSIPAEIADGVPNLKAVVGKMKVLMAAANSGEYEFHELAEFRDIAKQVLKDGVEELGGIIDQIAKLYGITD